METRRLDVLQLDEDVPLKKAEDKEDVELEYYL